MTILRPRCASKTQENHANLHVYHIYLSTYLQLITISPSRAPTEDRADEIENLAL